MRAIVTVLGKDRVGIMSLVCALLAQHNVNILDISQTILQGDFTMVMLVDAGACDIPFAKLAALLERLEREYHKKRIYLSVVEANRPAAALYESFGFRFTGERDTHGERVMCLRTR